MIEFPCHCGYQFKVMDEMAGGLLQCSRCGKLNDVPTLSDLASLEGDGTFKMDEDPKGSQKSQISDLIRTYAHGSYDDDGNEIDLRNDAVQMSKAGASEIAPEFRNRGRHNQPKYDPETGELVVPLEVASDLEPPMMAIPVGAGGGVASQPSGPAGAKVLGYARPNPSDASNQNLPIGLVVIFRPINLLVVGIVLILHFLVLAVAIWCALNPLRIIVFGPFVLGVLLLIPAHYACVIQDTGIDANDELPRPLRNVEFWDDLFYPGSQMLVAYFCSFSPAIAVLVSTSIPDGPRFVLAGVLALVGSVVLPSIILTASTSGSYVNLRPDRLMSVIWKCGPRYWLAVVFWVLATVMYIVTALGALGPLVGVLVGMPLGAAGLAALAVIACATIATFLGHLGSMELGFLYRRYHPSLPWAFQRHIPVNSGKRRTHTGPRSGTIVATSTSGSGKPRR